MPGIADVDTIDLVAEDVDGYILLVMIEERSWAADPAQASQLQEKINTYAGFILDGSMVAAYPEAVGRPVRVRLDCAEAPTGHFSHLVAHARDQLAARNIDFQVDSRN